MNDIKSEQKLVIFGKSYVSLTPEPYKHGVIEFLYKTINISNYRYSILTSIDKLIYLQENEHYVSVNTKGFNYFFILIG